MPDVVRLGDGGLVGLQDDLGAVVVTVEGAEDEPGEGGVGGDGAEQVVVQVEQHRRLQDQFAKLLNFETSLTINY